MGDDNVASAAKPSWHEREIALALQRLANARAHLATLEAQHEVEPATIAADPADITLAEALQIDIERYTAKAAGRFGGGARAKLDDCRRQQRVVLERLGVATIDELRTRGSAAAAPAVDPTLLDFARRECAEAEKEFLEVAAMVIPEVEPEPEGEDAEVIEAPSTFGDDAHDLDLRIEPSAAS